MRREGDVEVQFWVADLTNHVHLDVSEFTTTASLLMLAHACGARGRRNYSKSVDFVLDRSESVTLRGHSPRHTRPIRDLLPSYFDRADLPELKLQYQAIISR